jgi:uncharacterized membrane protein
MKNSYKEINNDYLCYVDNLLKKKPKKSKHKAKPQKALKERNQTILNANDNIYHKFLNYEFKG